MKLSKTLIIAALSCSMIGVAFAAALLDPKKSTVIITIKQLNVPVSAKFNHISGSIDYNPAHPEATKASVDIDISSFDLGDPEYNKEVLKKEWFNAALFPKASFISSSIKPGANGLMTASGKLTIKGRTQEVSFPVRISKDGAANVFDGTLPIHRLAFNIGEGDWTDTGTVADEVAIKFHVVAAP